MPFYCKNMFNHIFPIIIKSTITKNKMSCNTLCPYISSVWEQYSKILHNIHFDYVIWHHNAFCIIFVWKMSLWICCDIIRLIWTLYLFGNADVFIVVILHILCSYLLTLPTQVSGILFKDKGSNGTILFYPCSKEHVKMINMTP